MMSPKLWMVNLALAALALFFGINAYRVWDGEAGTGREAPVVEHTHQGPEADAPERFVKRRMPAEAAYDIVASRNLLSPDRKEYLPETPEALEQDSAPVKADVKISGSTITLYGVVIVNDYRKALITNPVKGNDEPQYKWVSVGDIIGNLTVAAIEKENVSFFDAGKKYDVSLYDNKKRGVVNPGVKKTAPQVISTEPQTNADNETRKDLKKDTKNQKVDEGFKILKTPFGNIKVGKENK